MTSETHTAVTEHTEAAVQNDVNIRTSGRAYLLPLVVDALGCDGGVGVCSAQFDAVALGDLLHLGLDGLDGLSLLVGLRQSGLELLVGCDQTLRRKT